MSDIPTEPRASDAASQRQRYGWMTLVALASAQVTSWGALYYAFSVFLDPMERELGWSRPELTGAYSLALVISGAAAFPLGAWLDRYGPRLLMSLGSVAAALLLLAWSSVASLGAFYLIWAGVGLAMAAVLYEPAFFVVTRWYARQRGKALTLLTVIGGFASVIYVPVATWLVRAEGWRMALVALAALLAVLTFPVHALALRERRADRGLMLNGAPARPELKNASVQQSSPPAKDFGGIPLSMALKDAAWWRLTLAFFLATLTAVAITVHLIPYLLGEGYSAEVAALATTLIGVVALPGRAIFTPLGEFLPRQFVTAAIFLMQALGLLVLLLAPGMGGVLGFALIFGLGFGAITPARAALVAQIYGPAQYGRINGVLAAALMCARAIAPVGVSLLYVAFGGYLPTLWGLALLSFAAALVIATVPHGPRERWVSAA